MNGGGGTWLRRARLLAWVLAAVLVVTGLASLVLRDAGISIGAGPHSAPGEGARYLRLDEGRAGEVAVSSSEVLEVWWREPGEKTWSAPQVIDGGDRYLLSTNVRVAGTTLAIRAFYNTVPPWEDESDDPGVASSVFIVCQALSCAATDHYEQVQEPPCERGSCRRSRPESKGVHQVPELSEDGSQVYFGVTEKGYAVWDADGGLRELTPTGLPSGATLGAPMLATDGSLRVVAGRADGTTCRLTLFTSKPLADATTTVAYDQQVTTTATTSTGNCATTLEAFTSDQLLIHTDRSEPAYLVRDGDAWMPTAEDPTGMIRFRPVPGRHAAGSVVRAGYWHWREVVIGSPDGRRLVAQVHFPGTASWTAPVTVATAPEGLDCFEIAPTSTPAEEPFYVSMRCRYRPTPGAEQVYVGVHAVTDDGRTWSEAFGDQFPTRVGDDLFFGGSPAHRWTPQDGLVEVGPPVPAHGASFLLPKETLILVTAAPQGSRCKLVVRVAERGETTWSAPLATADPWVPDGSPCQPVGQVDGNSVYLYFPSDGPMQMAGRVMRVDGTWVVTERRQAG